MLKDLESLGVRKSSRRGRLLGGDRNVGACGLGAGIEWQAGTTRW